MLPGTILFGIYNIAKKKVLDVHKPPAGAATMLLMCGAGASALLIGIITMGTPTIPLKFWAPFLVTATLNIGIQYGSVLALKYADVSLVVPIAATVPLWVIWLSYWMLGEWPTFWGKIGIIMIAVGAYVLNLQGGTEALPQRLAAVLPKRFHEHVGFYLGPWLRLFGNTGVRVALATAWLGAISLNFNKLAIEQAGPFVFSGFAYLFVALSLAVTQLVGDAWRRRPSRSTSPEPPKQQEPVSPRWLVPGWRLLLPIGMLLGLVSASLNSGYAYGIVPYVGSFHRLQIFWTVLLAGTLLGEQRMWERLAASLILCVGAALLSF